MGNYRFDDDLHKKKQLPAGQRGIGCMLMLILPTVSYFAAVELLKNETVLDTIYRMSPSLFGAPSIPDFLWKIPSLVPFFNKVYAMTNLEAILLLALAILFVLSSVIGFVYALAYRAVAPPRYGPLDAPPPRHKAKKFKR